jgi:hypothetical protein
MRRQHGLTEYEHSTQQIAREFFESLSSDDFATCPYHKANWERIAEVGCQIVEEFAPEGPNGDELGEAIDAAGLGNSDGWWLHCLIGDPIKWSEGSEQLFNGQSRVCALRAAGVLVCPVEMG